MKIKEKVKIEFDVTQPPTVTYCTNVHEDEVIKSLNSGELFNRLLPILGTDVACLTTLLHINQKYNSNNKRFFYTTRNQMSIQLGCSPDTISNIYKRLRELKLIETFLRGKVSRTLYMSINYDEIYRYMKINTSDIELLSNVLIGDKTFRIYNFISAYLKREEDTEEQDEKLVYSDYLSAFDLTEKLVERKTFAEILLECIDKTKEFMNLTPQRVIDENSDNYKIQYDKIYNDLRDITYQLLNHSADTTKISYKLYQGNYYIYVDFKNYDQDFNLTSNILEKLIRDDKLVLKDKKYCVKELMKSPNKKDKKSKEDKTKDFLDKYLSENGLETITDALYDKLLEYCNYLQDKKAFAESSVKANFKTLFNKFSTDAQRIKIIDAGILKNHNSLVYVMGEDNKSEKQSSANINNKTSSVVNSSSVKGIISDEEWDKLKDSKF